MYRIVSNLLIYGDMPKDSILIRLSEIFRDAGRDDCDKAELVSRVYTEIKRLLVLSTDNGFTGNLWHCYITYLIVMSENPIRTFHMMHKIRKYDDATFIHSLNVAILCNMFGHWINMPQDDLDVLTLAGLLHDVGKMKIPEEIIKKRQGK